jgi:hypothetical protein
MAQVNCPRCGNPSEESEFQGVAPALAAKISESTGESVPSKVCGKCFTEVAGGIARGSVLLQREKAKEQKKLMMWKSRVNLIKRARQSMNEKAFSDAAVAYEKYLKVLELVFEVKTGELNPEQFKEAARTQELTVVASAYWDLLRIYDTSDKYGERQAIAAKKLAQFLRFTPIYPDILKKAEAFSRSAKNPAVVKSLLKSISENSGRCFIATSAFTYHSEEVQILTHFRDTKLMKSFAGQVFTNTYYKISPPLASFLDRHPALKPMVRKALRKVIALLKESPID